MVTLDLLGHGLSERPPEMWRYGMPFFAQEVVGLLDHLGVDEAVVGGTSLGANATLEVASVAPERLRGMVVEMPVLDNALLASAVAFTPLMVALTVGEPVMKLVSRLARMVPENRVPWGANVLLDTVRQAPAPSAAVLQGLFAGRTAPHRNERRTFTAPTLVIGHHRDPVHPFSDAGLLAEELPELHPARGQLDPRAARRAGAPHQRDRRLHRRVLAPAPRPARRAAGGGRMTLR